MTQDQVDFIKALRTVSDEIADWAVEQIANGHSFDEMQAQLRRSVEVVDGWRIGRGI